MRADLLTTLCIFGKLVYPDLDAWPLIGREPMRELKFYQEILEEGRVEQARAYVRQAVQLRFGEEAAAELQPSLAQISDPEQLSQLHSLAIQARRLTELRRAFAAAVPLEQPSRRQRRGAP